MSLNTYRELRVWQMAIRLSKEVYSLTRSYPREELYGLVSQSRRAVVSIASNIAEGQRRGSSKEFRQFLLVSKGSLAELETQLIIARELGFVNQLHLRKSSSSATRLAKA
jgi:four helix bundle protein